MTARRASSPEEARGYRSRGHDDALLFALLLGLDSDYRRDPKAKKDVIDPAGDAHSVKSGRIKWQIFLYGRNRLVHDDGFQGLNGVGALLVDCIDAFPPSFDDYNSNKEPAKLRLQTPMREVKKRLQNKALLRAFLRKSIFNGGEVNYLTILRDGIFCVYWSDDVINTMANTFEVVNSAAHQSGQYDAQKVLFRRNGKNVGELEMRNDSHQHYRELRFNMNRKPCLEMLDNARLISNEWPELIGAQGVPGQGGKADIRLYGQATKKFGRW